MSGLLVALGIMVSLISGILSVLYVYQVLLGHLVVIGLCHG